MQTITVNTGVQMRLITRDELKAKLDAGINIKLVNTLGEAAFRKARIPGSINASSPDQLPDSILRDDEIIVYCTNPGCIASQTAYIQLTERGFNDVCRYAGGIADWMDAGYPVEGELEP
jgi:rhodanese-related sulfurtransferase